MKLLRSLRASAAVVCIVMPGLLSGCLSDSASDSRFGRYRPIVNDRSPWLWGGAGADSGQDLSAEGRGGRNNAAGDPVAGNPDRLSRVLKGGDTIWIYLRGIPHPEDIKDAVDQLGEINLPLIGTMTVEGMTTSEAESAIEKAYIDGGYYNKINVIVVAQEDEYFVRGEVNQPGRFPLSGDLTLSQAVATAAGYTDYAKPTQIKLIRGEEVLIFDGNRIDQRKDRDPLVSPGDIIVVPRRIIF